MTTATASDALRTIASKEEERFLATFFVLYKTARLVDKNNKTFQHQSEKFYKSIKPLLKKFGSADLKNISGRFFVNELMVRFNGSGLSGADAIISEWNSLGVGGVSFASDISKDETDRFFIFMANIKPNSENLDSLSEKLKVNNLPSIQLFTKAIEGIDGSLLTEEMRRQLRTQARSTFFKAMAVVQEVVVSTRSDSEVNISKTKRVVHSLIDQISQDESSLIELASIKDFDDYTFAHSTNVAVYSLTMGVRLGLDRARLSQLGFSALFHDIGKVKLPTDLITKPDAYDENDWIQMQRHPLLGAKTILRNLKFDVHTARAARGAFEHHINNDFTGYPMLRLEKTDTTLFSKIISIVDSFDALTSGRVYLKKSIEPEDVIKKMQYQMKVKFDVFLLKLFNDIIGVYPVGSLVLLTSDEIALVLANNKTDKSRPYVKVVGDKSGILKSPVWVDLASEENLHRKIVRKIEPKQHGLDIKDFILEN